MTPQQLYSHALGLHQQGKLAEAEILYRRLVAENPRAFAPRHMVGVLLAQQGRLAEAREMIDSALRLNPNDADAWGNLGNVLYQQKNFEAAVAGYDRALATRADAQTWSSRGNALHRLRRLSEALTSFEKALALEPQNIQALYKRAVMLGELKQIDAALAAYDQLLSLKPDHFEAFNNRNYLLWSHNRDYSKPIADLEQALARTADLPYGLGELLHLKMYVAEFGDYQTMKAELIDGVRAGARVARPFMFEAVSDQPADLQACARIYTRDRFAQAGTASQHSPASRRQHKKIRLGYLSGEFREQATAFLTAGLYERHDRERFEVIAIDNGSADDSAMSRRLKKAFDQWLDIAELTDAEAAAKIEQAEIDILINLNGYFGQHRMGVFAHRPAPLQVNYLGFPGTLGAPYMDYIIADAVVIPPDEQRFYDERVVTLPGCYQVNDGGGRSMAPRPSRAQAGLPEQGFVFCNFNSSYKLTPETFAVWMRILQRVEGSILWLLQAAPPFAENIRRQAMMHGVSSERILFAPNRPLDQHLARLSLADLFLDGLPYNAHTTASDALWVGLPLITQCGTSFPGRVATSILHAAGLPELVTHSDQAYEDLAVALAGDPSARAAIRRKLTRQCSLFDTDLVCRNLESAYARMWTHWLAGDAPCAFSV